MASAREIKVIEGIPSEPRAVAGQLYLSSVSGHWSQCGLHPAAERELCLFVVLLEQSVVDRATFPSPNASARTPFPSELALSR